MKIRGMDEQDMDVIKRAIAKMRFAARAESFRRFGFPHLIPQTTLLAITYKCNSRCKTCGIWKIYREDQQRVKQELTYDEFVTFLDKNSFLKQISLTGGEPFLRPDLHDMWVILDKKGYITGTTTNSVAIDKIKDTTLKTLRDLSGNNFHTLQISVDGLMEVDDYIRGVKGHFEKALNLLGWCMAQEKAFPFFRCAGVTLSITQSNYNQLAEYIDYFLKFGLKPEQVKFRPVEIAPYYFVEEMNEVKYQNKSEIIQAIREVYERFDDYREGLFYKGIIPHLKNPNKRLFRCYAGFTFCYIDPYWNVYPCIYWNQPLGNLRDYDFALKELWNNEKAKMTRNSINKGECSCWTRCVLSPSTLSNPIFLLKLYLGAIGKRLKLLI